MMVLETYQMFELDKNLRIIIRKFENKTKIGTTLVSIGKNYIYSLGGELKRVQKYSIQNDSWTKIPELKEKDNFIAATCLQER